MDKNCPFCGAESNHPGFTKKEWWFTYRCGTSEFVEVNKDRDKDCYEAQIATLQADLARCRESEGRWAEKNQGLGIDLTDAKVRMFAWKDYAYKLSDGLGTFFPLDRKLRLEEATQVLRDLGEL